MALARSNRVAARSTSLDACWLETGSIAVGVLTAENGIRVGERDRMDVLGSMIGIDVASTAVGKTVMFERIGLDTGQNALATARDRETGWTIAVHPEYSSTGHVDTATAIESLCLQEDQATLADLDRCDLGPWGLDPRDWIVGGWKVVVVGEEKGSEQQGDFLLSCQKEMVRACVCELNFSNFKSENRAIG